MYTNGQIILLDEGWNLMQNGITKLTNILEGSVEEPFSASEYITLYTTIYNMTVQRSPHDYSYELYVRFKIAFNDYVTSKVVPSVREKQDEFLLRELVIRWTNNKVMIKWLTRFFHYLDRYYVARNEFPALKVVGLTSFHDLVYMEVNAKVRDAVISLINKERKGEQIDGSLLKNVIDMLVELGTGKVDHYEEDFEKQMLDDTANYYKKKAAKWIEDHSCPDYMLKAEKCLKMERERAFRYLRSSSEEKLIKKVQHELLVTHANQLIEKEHTGCLSLLRDDKVEDLSRMFRLYHKLTKCLESVANVFKQHITAKGTVLVQKAEEDAKNPVLIKELIELHDKYMGYVNECFMKHSLFHKALQGAFEVFCNKPVAGISSAELLATFCDNILKKKRSQRLSDEPIEEELEKVIKLLAFIDDKDIFAEFSRKMLARRLLRERSAGEDHEKSFLSKLKQQCGGPFTSKMEGMVTDLILARDHQTSFEEHLRKNTNAYPGIDLTVTVLTAGCWPCYKSFDLNLPSEMVKCLEAFKGFFETRTKQRKLTWIYSLGSCNIIGKFELKTIELAVSTYQAAALLLFNRADRMSYSEIMNELNLSHEDLVRLLHSLSCSRYKILIKQPDTQSISPNDNFEFNFKFTDRLRKIKIPLPLLDEGKKVIEDVEKDRRHAVDAAIVRIMKSRKVLGYQELVVECVKHLSHMFKPDIKAIKKRIEDLVIRDYLERDKENSNLFNYVA